MGRAYQSKCYCTNLRRSAGAISDYYDGALRCVGLTASQYNLLMNLSRLKRANITRWAERVGLERSTMVRNIRALAERGWIEEVPEGHGRQFALSAQGEAVLASAIPHWAAAQSELEAFLGAEDADAILRIGEKLQGLEAKSK